MDVQKPPAKKRKLTDKNIPNAILHSPDFTVDSQMYTDLLQMEKRLDWTMTRKRVEVQDALGRPMMTSRTLRIFLSHTVSNQVWQQGESSAPDGNINVETGEGIPAWQFKIEGRLLETPGTKAKDRASMRKLSTMIKQMVVELKRDPAQYPDSNTVEWLRTAQNTQQLDGFTVRRRGDAPTNIRVLLYLDQYPEQYKVHPQLGSILGIKEESRNGVMLALWNYIKLQDLQDKSDPKKILLDAPLQELFRVQTTVFAELPLRADRFLQPPEPVVLEYALNPTIPPPDKPIAYDIELKLDDTVLKARMNHVVLNMSTESAKELAKIDDEISLQVQGLNNSHLKRTFLRAFSDDPQRFIQTWLESQSRDLETILGSGPSEGGSLRQDDLRRSEFFRLPWVEEAVAVQEGLRLAAKTGL